MMNLRKVAWVPALFMLLVLSLGAFGTRQASAASSADKLPATKNPASAKFTISGSISSSAGVIPLTGSGALSANDFSLNYLCYPL